MKPARPAVVVAVATAVIVTAAAGTPTRLPDIALSSVVLFHVERVVALLASAVAVLVVASRGWSGQLPSELSTQGIKYSDGGLDALRDEAVRARKDRNEMAKRIEALESEAYRGEND